MSAASENHTIRLLREMRVEFALVGMRFEKVDERIDEMDRRFDAVNLRIDEVTNILALLAGRWHDHEAWIVKLEQAT